MIKFAKTHRLASVLVTIAVSILATALLICVLQPSLSPATDARAVSLSLASSARGPIPGLDTCDYAVYYGSLDEDTLAQLKAFQLVILHPNSGIIQTQVAELQDAGVIVLGYVSIGEEPPADAPITGDGDGPMYYTPEVSRCCEVDNRHCEGAGVACYYLDEIINTTGITGHDGLPDVHSPWNSYYVDPGASLWQTRVKQCVSPTNECGFYGTDYVMNTLECDGLFLDTVDTASPWHPYSYTLDAMADFICTISGWYTDHYIVLNRGIFFADPGYKADVVRPCINGIVFEGYCSVWDWKKDEGKDSPWFEDNRDNWAPKLIKEASKPDGYTVFALDYFTPSQQISIAHQISETVGRWGWLEYISTPTLDTVRWEVWRYCRVWLPLIMKTR